MQREQYERETETEGSVGAVLPRERLQASSRTKPASSGQLSLLLWHKRTSLLTSHLGDAEACCTAPAVVQGPARRVTSLAVHPAQPHLAASGASDGGLAVWDLRFARGAAPPQHAALDQPDVGAALKARPAWLTHAGLRRNLLRGTRFTSCLPLQFCALVA